MSRHKQPSLLHEQDGQAPNGAYSGVRGVVSPDRCEAECLDARARIPDVVINTEHMSPHPSRIIGDTPPELATRTTKLDWWLGGLRQQQAAHFAFGLAPTRVHGAYSARGLAVPQPRWSCSQRAPPAGKAHGDGVKPCVCHAHWRSSCNIRAISV